MVFFTLKKIVSFWLMPVSVCLVLLIVGWGLIHLGSRSHAGRRILGLGILLFALFSNRWVSSLLAYSLETEYPPIPEIQPGEPAPAALKGCRIVVVLGGGHSDTPGRPADSKLASSSLARLVEGVRLLRLLPGATLLVDGPAAGGNPSEASVLAQAAIELGVAPNRIKLNATARDTEDESYDIRRIVGAGPIALVTSAVHMPRAMQLFTQRGIQTTPCPADYSTRPIGHLAWSDFTWDAYSISRSTYALHEWLGLVWLRIRRGIA